VGSALAAVAVGYLLATSYLVLRDDLIGAATARNARMQHAYEDRISALRAQVDRITSRQLLDQQLMESKVTELLQRQTRLTERHGKLGPILERADRDGTTSPATDGKPDKRASLENIENSAVELAALTSSDAATRPFSFWSTRNSTSEPVSAADQADKLFVAINYSLRTIESDQIQRVTSLAENAYQTAEAISGALESAGLHVDAEFGENGVGGPLVKVAPRVKFDDKVKELDEALDTLEAVKKQVRMLPVANPAPGRPISSTFGIRKDPLLGTPAMHSGMDFRAPSGSNALVTGAGVVIKAGWTGGYGRMVEVDHGNGLTTRYGHLSRILVKEGQKLDAGDVVGAVGSSGRSTGPHLHYEVRRNGAAVDPLRFIKAGRKLTGLL
jgi:murein DD-endopeptidase MepM/ murein hydrolase activator NlpD